MFTTSRIFHLVMKSIADSRTHLLSDFFQTLRIVFNKYIFLSQYVREFGFLFYLEEDQKETTFLGWVSEESGLAQYCLRPIK